MANPITWKNVAGPSFAGTASMMKTGNETMQKGMATLGALAGEVEDTHIARLKEQRKQGLDSLLRSGIAGMHEGQAMPDILGQLNQAGREQGYTTDEVETLKNNLLGKHKAAGSLSIDQNSGIENIGIEQENALNILRRQHKYENDLYKREEVDAYGFTGLEDGVYTGGPGISKMLAKLQESEAVSFNDVVGGEGFQEFITDWREKHRNIPDAVLARALENTGVMEDGWFRTINATDLGILEKNIKLATERYGKYMDGLTRYNKRLKDSDNIISSRQAVNKRLTNDAISKLRKANVRTTTR